MSEPATMVPSRSQSRRPVPSASWWLLRFTSFRWFGLLAVGCALALLLPFAVAAASAAGTQEEAESFDLGIISAVCEREPTSFPFLGGDCRPAEGALITVTTPEGEFITSCEATAANPESVVAGCSVSVPFGSSIIVAQDPSTIPPGYAPAFNPQPFHVPSEPPDGVFGGPVFLNLPVDTSVSGASDTSAGVAQARTLTIFKGACPADYAGDASADECDDAPVTGVPFRVGRPFSDAFYEFVPTDAEGLVVFEIGGLPLDGTLRVIEQLPADTERFVAYCVDGNGDSLGIDYPEDVGNPDLGVADVDVGTEGDVACDWYNVPGAEPADAEDADDAAPDVFGGIAPVVAPAAGSSPSEDRRVAIHSGTCEDVGDRPRFELSPLVARQGDSVGPEAATPAEVSFTTVDATVRDLLAENHAIAVFLSEEERRSGTDEPVAACGEVGGLRAEAGSLTVGLREENDSGVVGVAYLVPDPTTPGRTQVSVFVAEDLDDQGSQRQEE